MAKPTVTISDVDELEKSVKDLTSLSQSLRDVFKSINRETDVLGNNFIAIVDAARTNANLAERYLISQRLQEATQNRINEIKSKSSFLDSVGLAFKNPGKPCSLTWSSGGTTSITKEICGLSSNSGR